MPRFPSQNVLTKPMRRADRTVFVTAHYDTQRGSFLFHPKFVDRLPLFFNVCYAGVFVAIAGMALQAARFAAAGYVLWTALILCACACAVYLAAEIGGRYTPGANDNGAGVALALWLASEYGRRTGEFPPDCELRFLFTGSEEAGCRGMKAFLNSGAGLMRLPQPVRCAPQWRAPTHRPAGSRSARARRWPAPGAPRLPRA
jgi:hypothetical protein